VALAAAIKELPHGYKTIFLLHEVEGYEHQEIAEMLGCSVGNSKSQLHKAKLRIRELLARSVETRFTTNSAERSRPKNKRSLFQKWELPVGLSVALPQVAGPPV
jgi:hypothetical protein